MLLVTGPLRAETPARAVRLSYRVDRGLERCPDEHALRGAVEARLGYAPWSDDAPRAIAVAVHRAGSALRGEVTTTGPAGAPARTREIAAAGDDCAELVTSIALAISIAVDPEVAFRPSPAPPAPPRALPGAEGGAAKDTPSPPSRTPGSALPPPALVADPLPVALAAPASIPSKVRWHSGVGGFVAAGAAPGVTGGIAVQVGLRYRAFSGEVEGRFDAPATTTAAAASGGAVSAGLRAASVVPCFQLREVRPRLAACAVGTLGVLRGTGAGVSGARADATPFAAAGARVEAGLPIGGAFSVFVHGDVAATLTRTTLLLQGYAVWTTPPVSGVLGAGIRAHFP